MTHSRAISRIPRSALRINSPIDSAAIRRAIAATPGGIILESAASHPEYGRYSIYAIARPTLQTHLNADPFEALERLITVDPAPADWAGTPAPGDPSRARHEAADQRSPAAPRFVRPASETTRDHAAPADDTLPFYGGWIGFLGYECARFIEPFPRRHLGVIGSPARPLSAWWACDTALVHDIPANRWWSVGCDLPRDTPRPPLPQRLAELARWAGTQSIAPPPAGAPPTPARSDSVMRSNLTRDEYLRAVERAIEYIRAGDIFQVNFAQRFTVPLPANPWRLYEQLRVANPAMFAAGLAWDHDVTGCPGTAVLSSSPELFLHLRCGHVVTRPIKGTRPRTGENRMDTAARLALESSEKDAAELLMIVDLLRNDLGRVCEYGSVRVSRHAETEAHPTVFHRVATIEGDLRDGAGPLDLLRACFPGGSITGAPKVRAMQIIDELEPDPRGPYCGAIGYLGVDGAAMFNIAIRTIYVVDGMAHFWAGGGIVADSDPHAEYDESLAKAEGMRRALAAVCLDENTGGSAAC